MKINTAHDNHWHNKKLHCIKMSENVLVNKEHKKGIFLSKSQTYTQFSSKII